MTLLTILMLVLGFVFLVGGAELLIRGASHLALLAGMSPLVVGLTVVAYGTSAPELAVNIGAALAGQSGMALGNVVGSNIINTLVILGLSALAVPLVARSLLLRRDIPVMVGVMFLMLLLCLDGLVSRLDGAVLVGALVLYTLVCLYQERSRNGGSTGTSEIPDVSAEKRNLPAALAVQGLLIAAGLIGMVIGTRWVVTGAVAVAQAIGVSDLVIGLTVVAVGTSLPELATSVLATIRGHRDIAVGNVVGSNICNVLAVLGTTSIIHPVAVAHEAIAFDIPVMVVVIVLCAALFYTGRILTRAEGLLLVMTYVGYTGYVLLDAFDHPALNPFAAAFLSVILPAIVLALGIEVWRTFKARRDSNN